jgi:hypothetical protein
LPRSGRQPDRDFLVSDLKLHRSKPVLFDRFGAGGRRPERRGIR